MFWKKKNSDKSPLLSAKENLDLQLLRRLAPRKLPTWQQMKYLPKILEPAEKRLLAISAAVFVLAFGGLVIRGWLHVTEPVAAKGGSYTEGLVGLPRFINPLLAPGNDVDRDLSSIVFSGLMKINPDGSVVPDLAEKYSVSEDQKVYTIQLKENLSWDDGEPLTVEDVLYTMEIVQDQAFKSPLRSTFIGIETKKIDKNTVSFVLPEPSPAFLTSLAMGLLPQHVWYAIPSSQAHLAEANIKPIGSGPFKFKTLTKDSNGAIRSITFERNEKYHGEQPYLGEVSFKFYPDIETALEALRNKNVDGLNFLPVEYRKTLEGVNAVRLHNLELPQHTALFFNPEQNEILKDRNVRRAIALSIDRERIVREALGDNGKALSGPILPGSTAEQKPGDMYNQDEARKLLESSGWKYAEGANVRSKGEQQLKITITGVEQSENVKTMQIIKENLQTIGMETELLPVSKQKVRKDILEPRAYQVLLFGQITTSNQDVYAFWHSSQTKNPGNNLSVLANKDIDAAVQKLRTLTDAEEENKVYQQFTEKITSEAIAVFLYAPSYVYPISKHIKGLEHLQRITLPSARFTTLPEWYVNTWRRWR